MADKAASEEYLGEKAPAGTPTWGPENEGLSGRGWEESGRKGRRGVPEAPDVVPEAGVETAPATGTGGEPGVGDTVRDTDTSGVA